MDSSPLLISFDWKRYLIPDVVHLICEQAHAGYDRCVLYVLARTSRLFHEPALSYLWSNLNNIVPLVKCLPEDVWSFQHSGFRGADAIIMKRDWALPSELSRVMFYARYVKKLAISSTSTPHLVGYFLVLLAKALQGRILMPRIEDLTWAPGDDYEFPFIHAFLGPNTRRLEISILGKQGTMLSHRAPVIYKWNLPEAYPSLESFQMVDYLSTPGIITAASHVIRGWAHLRVIAINNLTPAAFEHVASLPSLRELSLSDIRNISPLPDRAHTPQSALFLALQRLAIMYSRPDIGIALLQTVTRAPLVKLSINCPCDAEHGRHLLKTLLTCRTAYNSLQSLLVYSSARPYLNEHTFIQSDITPGALSTESLHSLFVFANLSGVQLEIAGGFDLDDAALEKMARAWPRLESLALRTRAADPGGRPRLTLRALVILAKECPSLTYLSIGDLDTSTDALRVAQSLARERTVVNDYVVGINVLDSPIDIDHVKELGQFLCTVFRELRSICGRSGLGFDYTVWVREVRDMGLTTDTDEG